MDMEDMQWNTLGYGTLLEDGRRHGPIEEKTPDSLDKDSRKALGK